jgi:hypothetical protein
VGSYIVEPIIIYLEKDMSEEEEKEDVVIQGDIAEAMPLQEEKEIDRPDREVGLEEKGEEEGIPVPSTIVAPKISKTPKKSIKKNQNDATIASISEQLEKQANAIDKTGAILPPLQKQSELIKQIQSEIKQLQKQVSQVGSSIQRSSTGRLR